MFLTPQRSTTIVLAALIAVLVALAAPPAGAQTITMRDLGSMDGTVAVALAVNEAGDAVGQVVRASGANHAALWRHDGTATDLGALCGNTCQPGTDWSSALGINDAGQVVGTSYDTAGNQRGFIWENGTMTALPMVPGWSVSGASAINNAGQISGGATTPTGWSAIIWNSPTSTPQSLGVLGTAAGTAFSNGAYINQAGQIVGESTINSATFATHGFVWDSVGGMRDLGVANTCFDRNWASAINSHGEISGGAYLGCIANLITHMGRWPSTVGTPLFEDLGSLRGPAGQSYQGRGINDAGTIAGSSVSAEPCGEVEAVVWSNGAFMPLGGPYLLPSGCFSSFAYAINNHGQVVGQMSTGTSTPLGNELHAVIWTIPPPVNLAPSISCTEPAMSAWHHTNVVVSCTAETPLGLADPASAAFALSTTGEGAAVSTNAHSPVCDQVGHCSAIVGPFGPFKVDKTAPAVSVTGVINGLAYAEGFVPAAACSTTDALSGVQTSATLAMSGGPLVSITFTCSGAVDNAGNVASPVSVTVFAAPPVPVASLAKVATTPVTGASFMAIAPNQAKVYVVQQLNSPGPTANVARIDAQTYAVDATVALGGGIPFQIAIAPDGRRAYVAISKSSGSTTVAEDSRLAVLNLETDPPSIVAQLPMLFGATKAQALSGVAVHPTAPRVYVTDRGAGRVFVVDTDTRQQISSIVVSAGTTGPVGIQVTGDGNTLYVANRGTFGTNLFVPMTVAEVNLASQSVTAIPSGLLPSGSLTELVLAPGGGLAFVTSNRAEENRISVVDINPASPAYRTESFIATPATSGLRGMAFTSDGRYLYVADIGATKLIVVDAPTRVITRLIEVGSGARSVVSRHAPGAKVFVTINNGVAVLAAPSPVITAPASVSGGEGSAITLSATVSDADSPTLGRSWTYSASSGTTGVCAFGDPSSAATTITCSDNGTYAATLTVDDVDNLPVSRTVTVNVSNVAPDGTFITPAAVDEGQTFTVSITGVSDPSSDDTGAGVTYAFDCGSGYAGFDAAHAAVCTAPGAASGTSVAVRGKVRDKDGAVTEYSSTIAIVDTTSPVLHLPSDLSLIATSAAGAPAVFTATASDLVSGSVGVNCSVASGAIVPLGSTPVDCSATDAAGNISRGTFSIAVRYNVCLLYEAAKVNKGGSTVPIKLQLCSASGQNLSSASIAVRATSLGLLSSSADGAVDDAGQANPDGNFRYDSSLQGYIFNLKTTGLPTGTYELQFTAGMAPGVAVAPFKLR